MHRAVARWTAAWLVLASVAWGQGNEQRRLELLGQTPREQQRAAANQAFLQGWLRRSAMLYLHRLDALACRDLFSLGEEARFMGAIGNSDGTDHNLVFLDGAGAPSHLDSGPYVFPSDTFRAYFPATEEKSTWWHEVNHALLDVAGVGVVPAGHGASLDNAGEAQGVGANFHFSSDDHHVLVEGVGQRGAEAYAELLAFEDAARRADRAESEAMAQGRDPSEYALQRQLWGEAHQRFSGFLSRLKKVATLAPADLAAYRGATGVFFSDAATVAEFYRQGGLKRSERGELTSLSPPAWVFYPDLLLMPVQVLVQSARGQDLEQPGATLDAKVKDDVYRLEFQVRVRARGSAARRTGNAGANRLLGGIVGQGHLRVQVVEDDDLAGLALSSRRGNLAGLDGPGGPSVRLFDVDLSVPSTQPITIAFSRRKVSKVTKPTTFHVKLDYADAAQERRYDMASAQVAFTVGVGGNTASAPVANGAPPPPPPPSPAATPGSAPRAPEKEHPLIGFSVTWEGLPAGWLPHAGSAESRSDEVIPLKGTRPLREGANLNWKKGKWGDDGAVVEVYTRRRTENLATLADYEAMVRANEGKWAASFTHSEVKLGGRRAYLSVTTFGKRRVQQHWMVELDGPQRLWATILTDTDTGRAGPDLKDQLAAEVRTLVAALRFTPDDASAGLTVTRSVDKPLPPALQDVPVEEDAVDPRPPPPPPQVVRRDRRHGATVGGATPSPSPSPGGATTAGPRPGAAPTGTPPPPPPGGAATTAGPRPTGTPGGMTPPPPPGTTATTAGPRPGATPTSATPNGVLQGVITVRPNGADTSVAVTNTSRTAWHDCTIVIPQGLAFKQKTLDGSATREVLWKFFRPLPGAPMISREVLVQCREGTLRSPAPL